MHGSKMKCSWPIRLGNNSVFRGFAHKFTAFFAVTPGRSFNFFLFIVVNAASVNAAMIAVNASATFEVFLTSLRMMERLKLFFLGILLLSLLLLVVCQLSKCIVLFGLWRFKMFCSHNVGAFHATTVCNQKLHHAPFKSSLNGRWCNDRLHMVLACKVPPP